LFEKETEPFGLVAAVRLWSSRLTGFDHQ